MLVCVNWISAEEPTCIYTYVSLAGRNVTMASANGRNCVCGRAEEKRWSTIKKAFSKGGRRLGGGQEAGLRKAILAVKSNPCIPSKTSDILTLFQLVGCLCQLLLPSGDHFCSGRQATFS